jgi:glycerol transport system ATP-binding protein
VTVVAENVTKVVGGSVHVRDVSLSLAPGTINILLGPTLSGKTSIMRLLAGLDVPTSGRVVVDGDDVTGMPVRERSVAMVYQQFINYPVMTVYENIASPLRVRRVAKAEIEAKVKQAAKLLRLEPYLDRLPLSLSGGQQQRTAIARALVKDAQLVLLDEPLANLDYKLREELRAELPRFFGGRGTIFVYATTEPSEALLLGGNTATLREGAVTQFGPTPEVYRSPKDKATACIFSDPPMNFLTVNVVNGAAVSDVGLSFELTGTLNDLPDGRFEIGFRPNHVSLGPCGQGLAAVKGTVAVSEITGSESFVHVDVPSARWIAVARGVHELQPGQPIQVYLDPSKFFVFDMDGKLARAPDRRAA